MFRQIEVIKDETVKDFYANRQVAYTLQTMAQMTVESQEIDDADLAILVQVRNVVCKGCRFRCSLDRLKGAPIRSLTLHKCILRPEEDGSNFVTLESLSLEYVSGDHDKFLALRSPLPVSWLKLLYARMTQAECDILFSEVTHTLVTNGFPSAPEKLKVDTLVSTASVILSQPVSQKLRRLHVPLCKWSTDVQHIYPNVEEATVNADTSCVATMFPNIRKLHLVGHARRAVPVVLTTPFSALEELHIYPGVQMQEIGVCVPKIYFHAEEWQIKEIN